MAGEKYNIQLEAAEIFNRLVTVPELVQGLNELLQNFNSHNHDARNDERYQPLGNYAASVHEHQASDIQETTDKKVMTAEERNILSTLGTKYAKADFLNVITKSLSQNGYYKFPDGLLIQWGYASNSQDSYHKQSVYLPVSFASTPYSVVVTAKSGFQDYYAGRTVDAFYNSSFTVSANQENKEPFCWMAIGRWK
ncbi:hypothetical protein QR305_02013 [Bacteroides finegoldii]|uniref:gp53-like domain-containing protein n=1 Tax=Bacteroides finegoldii TaxID=338188 RepID=UPI00341284AF